MIQPQPSSAGANPRIVIVGGGFSGAALAWHLHRIAPRHFDIVIVEPRDDVGRGIAYDTGDAAHRINVPAYMMNLEYEELGHFQKWLIASDYPAGDPAAAVAGIHLFPTRAAFGDYVNAHIRQLAGFIAHKKTNANAIVPHLNGYRVGCASGEELYADIVVLAICHTPPQVPMSIAALRDHPRFIANPWQPNALRSVAPNDRVLIVGTGLTMADIVASLDRQGHVGKITAISRRGLRSQAHARQFDDPVGDFSIDSSRTTLSLLRRVRRAIADAAREKLTWHPVLEQMRLQGFDIWQALPVPERARLIRHLRPFWDTYRFRLAPQVDDVIVRRIDDGTLAIKAASVRAGASKGDRMIVDLRARSTRTWQAELFDAVVMATGPAHGTVFESNPLLRQIGNAGLARPDPLGLGIDVDLQSRVIDRGGQIAKALYVASPLARGTFGELMGAPDLARHARKIAETIAHQDRRAISAPSFDSAT